MESSHEAYVIDLSPILNFICLSSRRMAATICTASGRSAPCRGRSLAMTYLPLPNVLQVFGRPASRFAEVERATLVAVAIDATSATSASATVNLLNFMLYVPPWLADPASRHRVTRGLYQAGRARATARVCETHTRRVSDVSGGLGLAGRPRAPDALPPVRAGGAQSDVRGARRPSPTLVRALRFGNGARPDPWLSGDGLNVRARPRGRRAASPRACERAPRHERTPPAPAPRRPGADDRDPRLRPVLEQHRQRRAAHGLAAALRGHGRRRLALDGRGARRHQRRRHRRLRGRPALRRSRGRQRRRDRLRLPRPWARWVRRRRRSISERPPSRSRATRARCWDTASRATTSTATTSTTSRSARPWPERPARPPAARSTSSSARAIPANVATTTLSFAGLTNDPVNPATPSPLGSRYDGFQQNSHTGMSLVALPDVNGDGFNDLAVGAPDADLHVPGGGGVAVLYGRPRACTSPSTISGRTVSVLLPRRLPGSRRPAHRPRGHGRPARRRERRAT